MTWNGTTFALGYHNSVDGYSWMELDPGLSVAVDWGFTGYSLSAIAWTGTDSIVQSQAEYESVRYLDMASIAARAPTGTIKFSGVTRFTVLGGEIYGMWHSTAEMLVFDATTGDWLRTFPLAGYDTWTWGVSAFGDNVFSIDDGRQYAFERIAWFDRTTGALIADVPVPGNIPERRYSGWYCSDTRL